MSKFSDYYENQIIDHMLRAQAFTPSTATYLALFQGTDGLEANAPTQECPGVSYARTGFTISAGVAGTAANAANITFPAAGAGWGTIQCCAITDHGTAIGWGVNVNVLMWGTLDVFKTVDSGDTFQINAGDLDITVD